MHHGGSQLQDLTDVGSFEFSGLSCLTCKMGIILVPYLSQPSPTLLPMMPTTPRSGLVPDDSAGLTLVKVLATNTPMSPSGQASA